MANFFGMGNYAKPGSGISKDEPQKYSFFLFFELYFRKFWKLCEINILYFVFCIPLFIPCFLSRMYQSGNQSLFYLSLLPLLGIPVITSGLAYILLNFVRQQHIFLWTDFIDTIKNNWRQSLVIGVIDFVIYLIMLFSINFYHSLLSVNSWYMLLLTASILSIIIFTFMQYYLYVMLISFELTIKQLFKNAFIFSFTGFGHNIIITLFCGLLVLAVYLFAPISALFIPFILISSFGFIITFNAWLVIKKYMSPNDTTNCELNNGKGKVVVFKDTDSINRNK